MPCVYSNISLCPLWHCTSVLCIHACLWYLCTCPGPMCALCVFVCVARCLMPVLVYAHSVCMHCDRYASMCTCGVSRAVLWSMAGRWGVPMFCICPWASALGQEAAGCGEGPAALPGRGPWVPAALERAPLVAWGAVQRNPRLVTCAGGTSSCRTAAVAVATGRRRLANQAPWVLRARRREAWRLMGRRGVGGGISWGAGA